MPDPRLVSRAQRAATMLERAWEQWRTTQGLEAEPLPPVSSYVGYSIEEPWGRPRVVFGVDAEDAERLAALLQTSIGFAAEGGTPVAADPGYRAPGGPGFQPTARPGQIAGTTRACSTMCAGGSRCRAGRRSSARAGSS